ncbi:hypothetical protein ABMA27_002180 [Loxostege sticticalis]|uniref:Uncharacterized protein n=1 Tax=Loxostege sticticalis TaxID=481309 RepID=A0ABR3HWW1_LOXSC
MRAIIFSILVASYVLQVIYMRQEKNFGKFNLILDKFKTCKGPKRKDCCNISFVIVNQTAVDYDLVLNRPVLITKGKVTARTNGSDFLRLQMRNPCDHLFMKEIMRTTLNATQKCVIKPGHYQMVFDINNIAQTYYGGAFLYGHFTFKSLFMTNDCNLSCTEVEVNFVPKNRTD